MLQRFWESLKLYLHNARRRAVFSTSASIYHITACYGETCSRLSHQTTGSASCSKFTQYISPRLNGDGLVIVKDVEDQGLVFSLINTLITKLMDWELQKKWTEKSINKLARNQKIYDIFFIHFFVRFLYSFMLFCYNKAVRKIVVLCDDRSSDCFLAGN